MKTVLIVGGGISGASVARFLAELGISSVLFETSTRLGGMCRETVWNGYLVPEMGPHIFRTTNDAVWAFLARFGDLVEAPHSVDTFVDGEAVPFPPLTAHGPKLQPGHHGSVGDYLVGTLGKELFSKYYESYTLKRWGVSAFELSADMIPLIPVFRYPTGFFCDSKVGIPSNGFSRVIENMVDHNLISIHTHSSVRISDLSPNLPIVWTGRLDQIAQRPPVDCVFRGVKQTFEAPGPWPSVMASVINYPGNDVAFIRRTNYQQLLPWRPLAVGTEFTCDEGYPAYPVRTKRAVECIRMYTAFLNNRYPNVIPHGRLGSFEYLSIAQAIDRSVAVVDQLARELL